MPHDFSEIKNALLGLDSSLEEALNNLHSKIKTKSPKEKSLFLKELKTALSGFSKDGSTVANPGTSAKVVGWQKSAGRYDDSFNIAKALILKVRKDNRDLAFLEFLNLIEGEGSKDRIGLAFKDKDFVDLFEDVVDDAMSKGRVLEHTAFAELVPYYYQMVDFEHNEEAGWRCDFLFRAFEKEIDSRHCLIYQNLIQIYLENKRCVDGEIGRDEWKEKVNIFLSSAVDMESKFSDFCKARCEKLRFEVEAFERRTHSFDVHDMKAWWNSGKDPKEKNTKTMLAFLALFPIAGFYSFIALENALDKDDALLEDVKRGIEASAATDILCVDRFVEKASERWSSNPESLTFLAQLCASIASMVDDLDNLWLKEKIKLIADAAIDSTHYSYDAKYQKSLGNAPNFLAVMRPLVESFVDIYKKTKKDPEFILAAASLVEKGPCNDVSLLSSVVDSCLSCYKETKDPEFILVAASLVQKECWNDFSLANKVYVACVDKFQDGSREALKESLKNALAKISERAPDLNPLPRGAAAASAAAEKNKTGNKAK